MSLKAAQVRFLPPPNGSSVIALVAEVTTWPWWTFWQPLRQYLIQPFHSKTWYWAAFIYVRAPEEYQDLLNDALSLEERK